MSDTTPSPPARRARISDVAKAAGVSATTVSFVLSERAGVADVTRARVLAAVERLGYRRNRFARALRAGGAPVVAMLIPDITNPYYSEVMVGVEDACRARGWDVSLFNMQLDPEQELAYLERAIDDDVEGIVYLPLTPLADSGESLRRRVTAGPPLVLIDEAVRDGEHFGVGAVTVENDLGGRLAARHFADLGRTRAGLFGAPQGLPASVARVRGFVDECGLLGIDVPAEAVEFWTPSVSDAASRSLAMLQDDPTIDCFFAGNDALAIRLMAALRTSGVRVPEDVAVCGFDGISWSDFSSPPLTTVVQPSNEVGREAVQILADARSDPDFQWRRVVLPVELVVRGSTRA